MNTKYRERETGVFVDSTLEDYHPLPPGYYSVATTFPSIYGTSWVLAAFMAAKGRSGFYTGDVVRGEVMPIARPETKLNAFNWDREAVFATRDGTFILESS
jgi:hypothetical protein